MQITKYLLKLKVQQKLFPLLGIDLGTTYSGFSITYDLKNVKIYDLHYSPSYSPKDETLHQKVIQIIKREKVGGIIIGKPKKPLDYIDQFAQNLESHLKKQNMDIYITFISEDYTTASAQKISKTNNKFLNDGIASMLLLQRFIKEL